MKYLKMKKILTFLCLFIGICALFGSLCMFIDKTGHILHMESLLPYFKVLPFSDVLFNNYIFSGIALLIVNGITNFIAVYFLFKNKKMGIILGMIFGFTLMMWITIQFIIFPLNMLSITFFILGLIQLLLGYITYVFYNQEKFKFNINDYHNINKNSDTLVVYFSRTGYTRKIAYEEANKLNAFIIELKTKERTSGFLGFLWCGRFGMHKWGMSLEKLNIDLNDYKNIIIVSPIWVFSVCSLIREFCIKYKNNINNVSYIFTHFMNIRFKKVIKEVDEILELKNSKCKSICIRFGQIRKIYELN